MLVGLMFATIVMVAIGERLGLPWPALLTVVIAGAIFIPGLYPLDLPADLILPIFLPPLLWALARRTSWAVIRSQLFTVVSLSVLLVLATIAAVAGAAYLLLPSVGLVAAVLIGAALAPPDPVAVDAVAETTTVPRRLTSTLQMEGLFNDAASIVTFHVALTALAAGSELSVAEGIRDFVISVVVAVMLGVAFGFGAAMLSNWMDSTTARTALSWTVPFAVYLVAEEMHASGVIAIVIAAVEMNSRLHVGAEDRLSGGAFWETVEMLFTGVAFGLIGLNVRAAIETVGSDLWHAVWVGVVISVVMIAVRFAWMYGFYLIVRKGKRRDIAPLRLQEVLMLTWSGMRGLVSLALVLSIPAGFISVGHELSVIALMVLLCTMVIPGMTLPWLLSKLDLESGPDAAGDEAREALLKRGRRAAVQEIYRHADELSPQFLSAVEHWVTEESDIRAEHPEEDTPGVEAEKADKAARVAALMKQRDKANEVRFLSLKATQAELLAARREPGVDPRVVDELLQSIDRMLMAAKQDIKFL